MEQHNNNDLGNMNNNNDLWGMIKNIPSTCKDCILENPKTTIAAIAAIVALAALIYFYPVWMPKIVELFAAGKSVFATVAGKSVPAAATQSAAAAQPAAAATQSAAAAGAAVLKAATKNAKLYKHYFGV